MAYGLIGEVPKPFSGRVLVPMAARTMARISHVDVERCFAVIAVIAYTAIAAAVCTLAGRLRVDGRLTALAWFLPLMQACEASSPLDLGPPSSRGLGGSSAVGRFQSDCASVRTIGECRGLLNRKAADMMRGFRGGLLLGAIFIAMAALSPVFAKSGGTYPPISFVGQTYDFYKKEKIALGWGLYFAPHGQDPARAAQAIIVNYYDATDGNGHAISAEGIARSAAAQDKAKGAVLLPAFATPDPLNPGKFSFFSTLYYAYPADRDGDIWIGKVTQFGDTVVGMLYKQQVQGADSAAIAASVKDWLLRNLRTYGDALTALKAPPKPVAPN
jgi:hypothetical protein